MSKNLPVLLAKATVDLAKKDAEIERLETELNHFYDLCVDDPGKNPPLFWKDVAAEQKTLIRELITALAPFATAMPMNVWHEDDEINGEFMLTVNQFKLASDALAKAKAAGFEP